MMPDQPFTALEAMDFYVAHLREMPLSLQRAGKPSSVVPVSRHTRVNYIFRIELTDGRNLYLKQGLGQVRTTGWAFDPSRIAYEFKALGVLGRIWGPGVVPEAILYSGPANAILMSDVQGGGELLAEAFERGVLHAGTGERLGRLLGDLHLQTSGSGPIVRPDDVEAATREFLLEFKMAGARKAEPGAVESLLSDSAGVPWSLQCVDIADKNIFVEGDDVRLIDFEGVFRWDPAFDIGHAAAHYLVNAWRSSAMATEVMRFTRGLLFQYVLATRDTSPERRRREARYAAAFLLHRTLGKGQTPGLSDDRKAVIAEQARRWLVAPPESIEHMTEEATR